jgi:hypothetical protein
LTTFGRAAFVACSAKWNLGINSEFDLGPRETTENHTQIHFVGRNSVRTSQGTNYVSATKPNRLMLFRETAAVYCENRTEHKYTLWAENSVRTSQETPYLSTTMPNRLMLFRETVALYCENHTEQTNTFCGHKTQSVLHRKHITSPLQSPTG